MGESLADATREYGFNPAEKRGHDGKWSRGGGLLKSLGKDASKEASNPLDRASERRHSAPVLKSKLGVPYEHIGLKNKTDEQAAEMWESGKLQKRGVQFRELPVTTRLLLHDRAGSERPDHNVDPGSHSQREARDYLNSYGNHNPAARRLIAAELLRGTPIEEVAKMVKKNTTWKG